MSPRWAPLSNLEEAEHGLHSLFPSTRLRYPSPSRPAFFSGSLPRHGMDRKLRSARSYGGGHLPQSADSPPPWTGALQRHSPLGAYTAGLIGYIVLGFLLGPVPILFTLFGILMEVRQLGRRRPRLRDWDVLRIAGELRLSDVLISFSGIILVGVLNIFTSFVLSFLLCPSSLIRRRACRFPVERVSRVFASSNVSVAGS